MAEPDTLAEGDEALMSNHNVYRDGSVWTCRYCLATWPFPSRLPKDPGPCVPRRWGDSAPEIVDGYALPEGRSITRPCSTCSAAAGVRCWNLGRAGMHHATHSHRGR